MSLLSAARIFFFLLPQLSSLLGSGSFYRIWIEAVQKRFSRQNLVLDPQLVLFLFLLFQQLDHRQRFFLEAFRFHFTFYSIDPVAAARRSERLERERESEDEGRPAPSSWRIMFEDDRPANGAPKDPEKILISFIQQA